MASFDCDRRRSLSESDAYQKFPYKRVEPSISKFVMVLETNIDRLKKHQVKILKFLNNEDWSSLHTEQVNASRTVQQINATVREMERARNQIQEEDWEKFDSRVLAVKKLAVEGVVEFMESCGGSDMHSRQDRSGPAILHVESDVADGPQGEGERMEDIELSSALQTHVIPDNTEAAESWEHLRESLIELNALFHDFSTMIQDQQEKIDTIEENIDKAHENVQQGVYSLSKASKLKAAMFPVTGALIGGVIGGPVGLVAGLKVGSLAAVGGGIVGFAGGRLVKGRQDKIQETELKNLSRRENQESQTKDS
ncbi:syntaxin-17-like isoform X2 [Liolophura sinensis]|uniref:syntaxin-17-like isoform X2 n=1 Tax=Liolophura sinensis TaxID=3198878 RepID=UPI0031585D0F